MTVSFACQPEVSLKEAEQLLESLRSWCQKNESIDIVVNDWGMAQLVGRYPEQFELCREHFSINGKKIRGFPI